MNSRDDGDSALRQLMSTDDFSSDEFVEASRMILTEGKHMRFIFQGKLLQDHLSLQFYGIGDGHFVHCTLSDYPPPEAATVMVSPSIPMSLGSPPSQQQQSSPQDGPQGFDRLRESGFSSAEIMYIRNTFYASRQHLLLRLQQGTVSEGELRQMEEQWMDEEHSNVTRMVQGLDDLAPTGGHGGDDDDDHEGSGGADDSIELLELDSSGEFRRSTFDDEDNGSSSNNDNWSMSSSCQGSQLDFFLGSLLGFILGVLLLIPVRVLPLVHLTAVDSHVMNYILSSFSRDQYLRDSSMAPSLEWVRILLSSNDSDTALQAAADPRVFLPSLSLSLSKLPPVFNLVSGVALFFLT